jgi:hypothetical protein
VERKFEISNPENIARLFISRSEVFETRQNIVTVPLTVKSLYHHPLVGKPSVHQPPAGATVNNHVYLIPKYIYFG